MPLNEIKNRQLDPSSNCRHCGQLLKKESQLFCCSGCEMVWEILHNRGWDNYYNLKNQQITPPSELSSGGFEFLEETNFFENHVKEMSDSVFSVEFYIKGIRCAACVWLIEKVVHEHNEILDHQINMISGQLKLMFKKGAKLRLLSQELASIGYHVGLAPENQNTVNHGKTLALGIAGALAGNIMLLSFPLYTGGDTSNLAPMFGWLTFVLSIPLLFYSGATFFEKALKGLKHKVFHFDQNHIPKILSE